MQRYKRLLLVVLVLAAILLLAEWAGWRERISLEFLRDTLLHHRIFGLLVFVLLFALGNLIQIPGWLFLAAAVITLGKGAGGLVTYAAACISCALTFLAIRYAGGDALRQLDNRIARNILNHLHARPVRGVILLRTLFQTMPQINYALAMSGIRFRHYMAGTLAGLPLPILLYCVFFDYLARALHIA